MILGAKAEYRRRGIFALFMHEMVTRGKEFGAIGAEASWILEDNDRLNRPLARTRRQGISAVAHLRPADRMSIFDKCDGYTLAHELQAAGLYSYFIADRGVDGYRSAHRR